MRIYKVEFEGVYPVGNGLIIAAENINQAEFIALQTIAHTKEMVITEVSIDKPKVILYLSGDY